MSFPGDVRGVQHRAVRKSQTRVPAGKKGSAVGWILSMFSEVVGVREQLIRRRRVYNGRL